MTIRMALKHIRKLAPETEKTFQTIRQNRYCHPVRDWAIYDIQKAENLYRHDRWRGDQDRVEHARRDQGRVTQRLGTALL